MADNEIQAFSDLGESTINRVIASPKHDSLSEAMAADAVDIVPIVGDLMSLKRKERAEKMGYDMPDKPAYIENALSDLPPPLDTVGDAVVSQNVIRYVNDKAEESPFMVIDKRTEEVIEGLPPAPPTPGDS